MSENETAPNPTAEKPHQTEMPFAFVQGEPYTQMPHDLYIPPDALEVFLEAFEGPLDLLLYLIRRQNLDVLNIPVAEITRQYMDYIGMMQEMRLEVAAEYLVMAAMLAEIKSRMLLPRPVEDDADEDDPRAELVRRLQEYERYKQASEDIDELPRMQRDLLPCAVPAPEREQAQTFPDVELKEILLAFKDVLKRAEMFQHHHIEMEALSVRERMTGILNRVSADEFVDFTELFTIKEGRMGVVVTFLAVLELIKESLLEMIQAEPFAAIYVKARGAQLHKEVLYEDDDLPENKAAEA